MSTARSALSTFLALGFIPAFALAEDLSRYRNFQFGADLPTIVKQTGVSQSQVKDIHARPALIQELEWRPQIFGPSSRNQSPKEIVFRFYHGELYRITVNYDRYETEGLTDGDFVEAVSAIYGTPAKPLAAVDAVPERHGDREEILGRWEDSQFRFDLIRFSYGPSYRLVGLLKRLEAPAQAAVLEAMRLDDREAPQRDAARIASEQEAAKIKLDKARLANKPKFQP